jgi:hypothetical protein
MRSMFGKHERDAGSKSRRIGTAVREWVRGLAEDRKAIEEVGMKEGVENARGECRAAQTAAHIKARADSIASNSPRS